MFCHYLSRFVLSLFTDLPGSTLTVTPKTVFTGETVTLTCVIESYGNWRQRIDRINDWRYDWTLEWRYEWNKDSVMLQTSDRYTVNRNTLTISGVITSDAGQYTCKGHITGHRRSVSSNTSSAIHLSVTSELSFIILLNKPI